VLVVGRGVMISYPPLWSLCLSIDSKVFNGIDDTYGSFSYGRNNFDYTLLERSLLSLSLMVE